MCGGGEGCGLRGEVCVRGGLWVVGSGMRG